MINSRLERENEPLLVRESQLLKFYQKIAYAAGNFLTVLAISLWFPYNVIFFQQVVGLSAQNAGHIILIGQAGGALSTPFIGTWSDQCRCKIPGKRKIFHLLGIVVTAIVFFFLWYKCISCSAAPEPYRVLYYGALAVVFQFGWASTQVGQLALLPELCSQKKAQVELNSLRYCCTLAANIFVFCCMWGLLEKFGGSHDITDKDKDVFWIMALIIAGLGFCVSLPFQFLVPEKPNAKLKKLKWYKWFGNIRLYFTALILISARYVVLLPQSYTSQYFLHTLQMDKSSIAKGPLILYLSGFVTTLLVKRFRNRIGDKMTFFIGLAIVWGALIFFWVKDPTSDSSSHFNWHRDSIYFAQLMLGSGGTVVVVIALSMIAFLIENYRGSSAFVYGWVLFADRLSNGIGVYVIQLFVPCENKFDHICSKRLADYYRHIMVYVPFGASAVGLLIIAIMALMDWKLKSRLHHGTAVLSGHNERSIDDIPAVEDEGKKINVAPEDNVEASLLYDVSYEPY